MLCYTIYKNLTQLNIQVKTTPDIFSILSKSFLISEVTQHPLHVIESGSAARDNSQTISQ